MSYTPSPHLVFSRPPATGGDLVFGADAALPEGLVTGRLAASFPADQPAARGSAGVLQFGALLAAFPADQPTASGSAGTVVLGALVSAFPATSAPTALGSGGVLQFGALLAAFPAQQPQTTGSALYMSLTERPTVAQARTLHQVASPGAAAAKARHQQGTPAPEGARARHQDATATDTPVRHLWPGLIAALYIPLAAAHQDGSAAQGTAGMPHQDGTRTPASTDAWHQDGTPAQRGAGMPHQDGTPIWQGRSLRHQDGRRMGLPHRARHQPATARPRTWAPRHQDGRTPPPGQAVWPGPQSPAAPASLAHLVFACPPWAGGPVHLVFGRVCGLPPIGPQATLYILPARFYMAVHTLTAHRLPDLAALPIFDVSLSADAGSFAWTFSASGPVDLFDALAPAAGLPAQIRITLDGIPFVFVVDSLQREERFGKRGTRISGRSATALLARPYAREATRLNAVDATAQQLAEQALEFTGATLDWGLTDWLVPPGAWSHTGTPLAAVQAIVEAAGGYLQSHRTAATLLARHPYPTLPGGFPGGPWNWGGAFAADVELAPDAIITSGIERRDGPDVNAVYVSGTTQGVSALVLRTGTAGEKLSGMVTDPLITAPEVAMQRGLSVLGAAGPKHLVRVELPILTGAGQPGVLDVGQLVQVNAATPWRGRVRSVSVNAAMPKARQTVQIERHLETA